MNSFFVAVFVGLLASCYAQCPAVSSLACDLPGSEIPKWVNQLTGPPPVYSSPTGSNYTVYMTSFSTRYLPSPLPLTPVFGYAGNAKDAVTGADLGLLYSSPGATFEVQQYQDVSIHWINNVSCPHIFAVDPTLHWANPNSIPKPSSPWAPFPPGYPQAQSNIPFVTHVHGAEVFSGFDGHPDAWFTNAGNHGSDYHTSLPVASNGALYRYTNTDDPTTMWYHDHALGITRLNVYAGLFGFYIIRNNADPIAQLLPNGKYDMPLLIQDRRFNRDGSLCFPLGVIPINKTRNDLEQPYWSSNFIGDTILINGKAWPNLNVDRGQYFFRLLDGSDTRFYNLSVVNDATSEVLPMTVVMRDSGYIRSATAVQSLFLSVGQRIGVLVDFSSQAPGSTFTLTNSANAPFPNGAAANRLPQLMRFTVGSTAGFAPKQLPSILMPLLTTYPTFAQPATPIHTLTLDVSGQGTEIPGVTMVNGQLYSGPISQVFELGKVYDLQWVNLVNGAHPMHIHLVTFQVISRQNFNKTSYKADWYALNGGAAPYPNSIPLTLDPTPYLEGPVILPRPEEQAFLDVVSAFPNQVVKLRMRFGPQAGGMYPFDVFGGPGYMMHCHIGSHEDNEMMIKMLVRSDGCQPNAYQPSCNPSLQTPCCFPNQLCLRHASNGQCTNSSSTESYLCIPQHQVVHHM